VEGRFDNYRNATTKHNTPPASRRWKFGLVTTAATKCRMDLRQRQARQLSVNLVRVPLVRKMALYDFQDFGSCPLNEGNSCFIQFNKRPCSGNHNRFSHRKHHP